MKKMLMAAVMAVLAGAVFAQAAGAGEESKRKRVRRARRVMRGVRQAPMEKAKSFGRLSDGREARIWRLQGRGSLALDVTDYGGRVVRVYAPDRHGNLADVTLGWNTAAEYEKYGFSMGTIIGRFGNRIALGKFKLDGTEYQLPVNEKKDKRNCNLHGGPMGWNTKLWTPRFFREGPVQCVEFSLESPDGDMGFPGKVVMKVTYRVYPNDVWSVDYEAVTDKPTVINPTHHSYWNLAGESSGDVLGQQLKIFADQYTQTDEGLIPTVNAPVKGTGFDFTSLRAIGAEAERMKTDKSLAPMDNWYDHNFVLRGAAGELKPAAVMYDPVSGRRMEIWTTEPGMQMYGAQNMTDALPAKAAGKKLCKFAGVALETQHFPDSPNRSDFPSTRLDPGQTFRSRTEYRFSAVPEGGSAE
jgi:aldose 1-epimerase